MDLVDDLDVYDEIGMYIEIVRRILALAVEIVRDGLEGKKIGTMFVIGDSENVMKKSLPLILDLFDRQKVEVRSIHVAEVRETIKKLAYLDGAFIISEEGLVVSAARHIKPDNIAKVQLGLGTRHLTGAAITAETRSVAIIVSSSGNIRVYAKGRLVREYRVQITLMNCTAKYNYRPQYRHRLKDLQEFKSDNDRYLYPEPYVYNDPADIVKKNHSVVKVKNNVVNISYEHNNCSFDYSFRSPMKKPVFGKCK